MDSAIGRLSFGIEFYEENRWQKFSRRLKEEPLIPLGCALTCWALFQASRSIRAGDPQRTNRMFRARIYAQGFTLLAIVGGSMYWQTDREKRKEFDDVVAERKAKEKNEAWIRELEIRDAEEKELKAERQRRIDRLEKRRKSIEKKDPAPSEEGKTLAKEDKKGIVDAIVESSNGASSMVDKKEQKKGVLESVSSLVWGK
ncbi:hypothetical protein PZA11_006335 [Diplocarpon coronariae]